MLGALRSPLWILRVAVISSLASRAGQRSEAVLHLVELRYQSLELRSAEVESDVIQGRVAAAAAAAAAAVAVGAALRLALYVCIVQRGVLH